MMSRNSFTRTDTMPHGQTSNTSSEWSAHKLIFSLLIVGIGGFELMMGTFLAQVIGSGHDQGVPLLAAMGATPLITLLAISLSSRRIHSKSAQSRPAYLRVVPVPPVVGINESPLEP